MIIDLTESEVSLFSAKERVVIVGAGTVGLYLASCLARGGIPVALVEAGGRAPDARRNELGVSCVGMKYSGHKTGRSFGLGGTSVLWGGQLAEFEAIDFQCWPLSFDDLRPYYGAVYRDLSLVPQDAETYRTSFGNEPKSDDVVERFFTHWLPQPNFARIFKSSVVESRDVPIYVNGTVNGIRLEGGRARAVSVYTRDGRQIEVAGRDFVFCNGTIEIVRFFLSTGAGGQVPWSKNGRVGEWFQDHLAGTVGLVDILDEKRFREYFEHGLFNGHKVEPKLRMTGRSRKEGSLGICGMFSFRSDVEQHVANVKALVRTLRYGVQFSKLRTLPADLLALARVLGPIAARFIRDRRIMALFDRGVELRVQCEQRPIARSRIRLRKEAHPVPGFFGIDIDWQTDGAELEHIRQFAQCADRYLQKRGLARLTIDERVDTCDPQFLRTMTDTYHQSGGMRMSTSPADGVVDRDCRIWGTQNVYVPGAAVFPSSGHANTTLTALALAARVASSLAGGE